VVAPAGAHAGRGVSAAVSTTVSEAAVRAAIDAVVDPCSRLYGTNISLLDLGMVESVRVDGGAVRVDLLLDDPLCMYTFVIQRELRERIAALDGVASVEITVLPDFGWSRERVSPAARQRLLDDGLVRRLMLVPATAAPGHNEES
jgi:metal-sulfur cluster biosynthetic enzyme